MKTILLYGKLGKQFGRLHRYDVRSVAEAVHAMCITLKGFRAAIDPHGAYRVLVGGKDGLSNERLLDPVSDKESIRIVPVIAGAGRGLGQIIIGAALIWASGGLAASLGATGTAAGVAGATTGAAGFLGITAGTFTAMGLSLVLGGISQMLFKQSAPTSSERPENQPSFAFNGAINTAAQGNPVPVFYGGPMIIGSQVVSAGLSVEQIA